MKTVYNMSTGQVVETSPTDNNAHGLDFNAAAMQPQLQLQTVITESYPKRGIPPTLVLADLNAFLNKMR